MISKDRGAILAVHFAWQATINALRAKGVLNDDEVSRIKAATLQIADSLEASAQSQQQLDGARLRAEILRLFSLVEKADPHTPQEPGERP